MSSKATLGWPSFGFFMLVSTHGLLGGVLLWGWQRPPLDEAFELLARRDLGALTEFAPEQIRLLEGLLERHPGFSRALLGKAAVRSLEPSDAGWVARSSSHVAIRVDAGRPTRVVLEARGEASDFPLGVRLRARGHDKQVTLQPNQPQAIEWSPGELGQISIAVVDVEPAKTRGAGAPTWAVRVTSSDDSGDTP